MKSRVWIGIGVLFWGTCAYAAIELKGDPAVGLTKSQTCVACHGTDGNSNVPAWPNIAGQSEKYLIEQLEEFRKGNQGKRFEPVMYGMTQSLTDQDIVDLAAYFASQKPATGVAKQDFVAMGEKIYRGGNIHTGVVACGACHDPQGFGNYPAGFPRISGQHPEYILDQLKRFKTGARANGPNGIMQDISKRMTDEEMQAVSSYVSGLH